MESELIQEIGLTETEARIYLDLLKNGSSLAGNISRNTGIHRRSVYDAIERLIKKGLVSYIKTNNRRYFEAVEPKRLIEILKEKEEKINAIIPKLEILKNMAVEKKETLFFRGKQSLKYVFDDQIINGKEILIFGDSVNVNEILSYYFLKYDRERVKKNIKVRIIFDETARKNKELKSIPLSKIKFIPRKHLNNTSIYIYDNNVSIVVWSNEPKAILIKEKNIANTFRNLFEFVWNIC